MEKQVNGRRGFLKGFGLGGVVLGGALGGYYHATREVVALANSSISTGNGANVNSAALPGTPDISHLAPNDGISALTLTGDNRPPPPPKPAPVFAQSDGYTYTCSTSTITNSTLFLSSGPVCPTPELNRVSMAVGKDDRLWIKVGDNWKRVVLEG
jgi:hypothetical protein